MNHKLGSMYDKTWRIKKLYAVRYAWRGDRLDGQGASAERILVVRQHQRTLCLIGCKLACFDWCVYVVVEFVSHEDQTVG